MIEISDRKNEERDMSEQKELLSEQKELLGVSTAESNYYFFRLIERDRIVEKESNIIHNPEVISICLIKAMNGHDINYLPISEIKRLILSIFYYES